MTFKILTCISVECNHCGDVLEDEEGIPHFDTEEQAARAARGWGWAVTRDGKAFCEGGGCRDARPACRCNKDGECGSGCAPDCPCELHPALAPVTVSLGQLPIGGGS